MLDEFAELNEPVIRLKVVLIGEANVGKSSIVNRYWRDTFNPNYLFTVGIDFHSKIVHTNDGRIVKMQLWDTAGQERFRALLPSYLRDCSVVIIAYDLTNKKSFENLSFWINYVKQRAKIDVKIIVIGTKLDLKESREVEKSFAENYCLKSGFPYFEVSSKSGENLNQLFECAANYAGSNSIRSDTTILIDHSSKRAQSRCNC